MTVYFFDPPEIFLLTAEPQTGSPLQLANFMLLRGLHRNFVHKRLGCVSSTVRGVLNIVVQ